MSSPPGASYDAYQFSPAAPVVMFVFTGLVFLLPLVFYSAIMARYCCDTGLREELGMGGPVSVRRKRSSTTTTTQHQKQPGATRGLPTTSPSSMLLSFRSLTYTVPDAVEHGKTKTLLHDVTGYFAPGTLNALVGPSGCGKTTLLTLLADAQTGGTWTGDIRVNGKPRGRSFRKNAAFVVQNDRLFDSLTIRESLWFAVELRTGVTVRSAERREIVHDVLADLDLLKWADVACGKLSGGQKRRVTVALELVARPTLIFLDEPTSGLDGSGALALVRVLKKLAEKGKTVVCTIHQPRIDAFVLFNRVHMLSAGRTVFYGSVQDITVHFKEQMASLHSVLGAETDAAELNPADLLLDLTHSPETSAGLDVFFSQSGFCKDLLALVDETHSASVSPKPSATDMSSATDNDASTGKYVTTQLKQMFTLLRRALMNDMRSMDYIMQWVLGIIMMLFMGMLYCYVANPNLEGLTTLAENLDQWGACTQNATALALITNSTPNAVMGTLRTCGQSTSATLELVHARMSLLYQLLAGSFFSEMPMVAAIYEDRGSYFREHGTCYSTSAWIWFWIVKISFSGFVKGIVFPPFVYFSAQLTVDAVGYFFFSMFMALMSIAGGAVALFAVVATETFETATVSFVVVSLLTQNLSGYWIPLFKIGWWFRWICYVNFFFYSYEGVVVSQFLNSNTRTSFQGDYTSDLNLVFVTLILTMTIIFAFFLCTWLMAYVQGHKPPAAGSEEDEDVCCGECCRGRRACGRRASCWGRGLRPQALKKQVSVKGGGDLAFQAKAAAAGTPALTFGL